jgi:hypothetical protein
MGLIYRGETRFDLKGAIPVKLPLLLSGQRQIGCLVQCNQRPQTWKTAGQLEQFAFVNGLGVTTLKRASISFDENQLVDLDVRPQSFLRFTPVNWLVYRTNISIYDLPIEDSLGDSFPVLTF